MDTFVFQDQKLTQPDLPWPPGLAERRVSTRLPQISMTASRNIKSYLTNVSTPASTLMEYLTGNIATVWRIFIG